MTKKKSKKRVAGVLREDCHGNREGLTKMTSELVLEGAEGHRPAESWEKSKCKGPVAW